MGGGRTGASGRAGGDMGGRGEGRAGAWRRSRGAVWRRGGWAGVWRGGRGGAAPGADSGHRASARGAAPARAAVEGERVGIGVGTVGAQGAGPGIRPEPQRGGPDGRRGPQTPRQGEGGRGRGARACRGGTGARSGAEAGGRGGGVGGERSGARGTGRVSTGRSGRGLDAGPGTRTTRVPVPWGRGWCQSPRWRAPDFSALPRGSLLPRAFRQPLATHFRSPCGGRAVANRPEREIRDGGLQLRRVLPPLQRRGQEAQVAAVWPHPVRIVRPEPPGEAVPAGPAALRRGGPAHELPARPGRGERARRPRGPVVRDCDGTDDRERQPRPNGT